MLESKSVIATPPGATIKEQIVDRGISQKEFALRMNLSEKHISNLINGSVRLTDDVAIRLETVLGIPASFWNRLETNYREKLGRIEIENSLTADINLAKNFPYNELSKLNWLPKTNDIKERVLYLRKFFEVVSLERLDKISYPGLAYRSLSENDKNKLSLMAWTQKAKLEARAIETSKINKRKLETLLPKIRTMSCMDPLVFQERLSHTLATCGIAFICLPHINSSYLHGATFIDNHKIVLGLSLRGKYADRFWFSLFHELAHITLGHLERLDNSGEIEEEANKFAKNVLIPNTELQRFLEVSEISEKSIITFASELQIHPSIVVGRLQNDQLLQHNEFNHLKVKYNFAS